jgi:hypothetical protein
MSLKTIDTAIGIVFLYLLLTFMASAILEVFARARNWRAKNLFDAVGSMLVTSRLLSAEDVYRNPLVIALSRVASSIPRLDVLERAGWRAHKQLVPPSYIPAGTFSAVVLENLIDQAAASGGIELSPDGAIKAVREVVEKQSSAHQDDALLSLLKTTLATQGSSIQAVRSAIEKWFNDTMDRASGWYKRKTQSVLLLFGLIVALGGNIDTITVARWLYQSDAARQATLAAATDYVNKNPPAATSKATSLDQITKQISDANKQIGDLQYPIGWGVENVKGPVTTWIWEYLLGCIITAIAVSMGSTFWFDSLQNLIKLRSTGPKPASR